MTEAEWLACRDPEPMLMFLRGKGSERKLRLFACACCRRLWPLFDDERIRSLAGLTELAADGLAGRDRLELAARANNDLMRPANWYTAACRAARVAGAAAAGVGWPAAWNVTSEARTALHASRVPGAINEGEQQRLLLADIFGNPFRPSPPLPPTVLAWSDRTIPRLAQAIYEDRKMPEGTLDTARLAILADALLDAGCEDEALIQHCREPGVHVRGCWAVDLLLGKQ